DVGTALVKIRGVVPGPNAALPLRLARHPIDADNAFNIPPEIVAVQLDFEVRQPVELDPFAQRLRQTVTDALGKFSLGKWIERAHEVIERHGRLRSPQDIGFQRFTVELCAKVVPEVMSQELRTVRVIAIQSMRLTEGVVQSCVERAGDDQGG